MKYIHISVTNTWGWRWLLPAKMSRCSTLTLFGNTFMLGLQNIKIVIIFGCLQCVVSIGCVLWVTLGRHQSGLKTSLGSKRYYSISLSKQLFIYFLYHRGLIKISSLWVLIRTRVDAFFVLLELRIKGSPQPGEKRETPFPFYVCNILNKLTT